MEVFLDTNVFLDAMLQNRDNKKAPIEILNLCDRNELKGYTSGVSFANITYFIQKATEERPCDILVEILGVIEIIALHKEDFLSALNVPFKDIEDAFQNRAAKNIVDLQYLITRNIKDFKNSDLSVITPEAFLKIYKNHL